MIKSMRWSDDRFFIVLIKKIKSDLERSERETGMCVCVCVHGGVSGEIGERKSSQRLQLQLLPAGPFIHSFIPFPRQRPIPSYKQVCISFY